MPHLDATMAKVIISELDTAMSYSLPSLFAQDLQ
jgi:hypothetical protein